MSNTLSTQIVTSSSWPEDLRPAWSELLQDSPTASMFQTWEWQTSWWKHYRGTKRPHILTLREGNDLVGVMPMTVTTGPWRALASMGQGKSDYLHPLARRGYEEAVGAATAGYVSELRGIDYVDLTMIRENQPVLANIGAGSTYRQYACPVIDLPPTYEAYVSTLGERLQRYLRRFDKLSKKTPTTNVSPLAPDEVAWGMDVLFDLHTRSWQVRGSPGGFAFRRIRSLFQSWARAAADSRMLRLNMLRVEGEPAGVLLAAKVGETCFGHMHALHPDHLDLNPGWVLMCHSIDQAIGDGCNSYDLMLGQESYKYRLGPQNTYANYGWRISAPSLRGRLAKKWYGSTLPWATGTRRRLRTLASKLLKR